MPRLGDFTDHDVAATLDSPQMIPPPQDALSDQTPDRLQSATTSTEQERHQRALAELQDWQEQEFQAFLLERYELGFQAAL